MSETAPVPASSTRPLTLLAALLALSWVLPSPALAGLNKPAPAGANTKNVASPAGSAGQAQGMFFGRVVAAADLFESDPATSYRQYLALLDDDEFPEQSFRLQAALLYDAAYLGRTLDEGPRARGLVQRAADMQPGNSHYWYLLALLENDLGDLEASARALAHYAKRWPERLDGLSPFLLRPAIYELAKDSPARIELLQSLFDSGWERERLGGADAYWYELALVRANQGDVDALRIILPRIRGADELVRMRADRRFDAVLDRSLPDYDPRLAAERQVERMREQVRLEPDSLEVLAALQSALLMLGRNDETISLADAAEAAIAAAPADEPAYSDPAQLTWVLNLRAIALRNSGRIDPALAELERASGLDEAGNQNVSQVLNLAHFQLDLGRAQEARATVLRTGTAISAYGRMVRAMAELRAAVALDDPPAVAAALATLEELREHSQWLFLSGFVRAGSMDEAATVLIELLHDPWHRGEVLGDLQGWNEWPALPGQVVSRQRWEALLARDDVSAALDEVGRKLDYDLYGVY